MSKKHRSKHCSIAVAEWDNETPLYKITIGDLEQGRFKFGIPVHFKPMGEGFAMRIMLEIDDYLDNYIESLRGR
jgi:hypothetical protein